MAKHSHMNTKLKFFFSAGGVVIICLSIIAILGFFNEGGAVGDNMARAFRTVLGRFSWIGPFITVAVGSLLITYRPVDKPDEELSGARGMLPGEQGVVSKGRGFKTYFADTDPLDETKEPLKPFDELKDVGGNFNTYFGPEKHDVKLVSLGGNIPDYFSQDEVAASVHPEPEIISPPKQESPPKVRGGLRSYISQVRGENAETSHTEESVATVGPSEQLSLLDLSPAASPDSPPEPAGVKVEVHLPGVDLLDPPVPVPKLSPATAQQNAHTLEDVLSSFGVKVIVSEISQGPAITRYEVQPAPGVKISRIVSLADDIALALAAPDVRIEAPIPGKSAVGIEVPNKKISPVRFREVLEADEFRTDSKLRVALGKDIAGKPVVADLARMPHLLVAGATGSGKSVCMNTIITSILYTARPDQVKFLLIDPKMVELARYNGIPHLVAPVVTDPKKAAAALRWIVNEMETRYELFAAAGVRDIIRYNEVNCDMSPLPYVVVLIDELADLMLVAPGDVEEGICRLAQMARAAGIHLVVATQRPSVDVITGIIKANIPSRIAFAVSSQIDSRTILDGSGAEKLLGKGDMLYYPLGMAKPLRVQGCFLSDQEVEKVVGHWKNQAKPEYLTPVFEDQVAPSDAEPGDDELFYEAGRLFITSNMASVSLLQRRLRVGYTRAARLMDLLEQKGVVGGFEGSKPRQVLMTLTELEDQFAK